MKTFSMLVTGLLFVLVLFSCTPREEFEPRVAIDLTTREIAITVIDELWKVPTIEVSRGDTVVWTAPQKSDVYIQFMDDKLVGSYTQTIERGGQLNLIIGPQAKQGDNQYAVFLYNERVYARGDSPPRLIVR